MTGKRLIIYENKYDCDSWISEGGKELTILPFILQLADTSKVKQEIKMEWIGRPQIFKTVKTILYDTVMVDICQYIFVKNLLYLFVKRYNTRNEP